MIKKYGLLFNILLLGITKTFSQEIESTKVLLSPISISYKGDTKDGVANGKGVAKGEDTYTGEFKNGLPDGKGKYTYKNGNSFTGFFSNGLKNGKGVFNYSINGNSFTQKGYWLKGDYAGPSNPEESYHVSLITGIDSYSINKMEGHENNIIFAVTKGETKYVPSDFTIKLSSGQYQTMGKNLLLFNYNLPINCEIYFTVKNSGQNQQCCFTFEILKPGKYEVLVSGT